MSRLERIVAACGGDLIDGGRRALIPGPGHSARDRSVSLLETDDGRIVIHCFSPQDNWREVRRALQARGLLGQERHGPASRSNIQRRANRGQPRSGERVVRAKRFWDEARPLAGTVAERYLIQRAIVPSLARSSALRFHARMTSFDDRLRRPALVAAIVGSDGALQGVQITLLSTHGSAKASVATPRRVIGWLMGGAVQLAEPEAELAVAEGVESAASAAAALDLPTWALLSAHNLALFTPPSTIRRLVVALDNDPAGRAAFERLRHRTHSLRVEGALPPRGAKDWNDWARMTTR